MKMVKMMPKYLILAILAFSYVLCQEKEQAIDS